MVITVIRMHYYFDSVIVRASSQGIFSIVSESRISLSMEKYERRFSMNGIIEETITLEILF